MSVPGSFATVLLGINDLDDAWGYYLVYVGNSSVEYYFIRASD